MAVPDGLIELYDRLGRLEGILIGLQNSLVQYQTQMGGLATRVEQLEQRQRDVETTQASQSGGVSFAGYFVPVAISLASLVLALNTWLTTPKSAPPSRSMDSMPALPPAFRQQER